MEFLDKLHDKLMFGTDSCKRSDVNMIYRIISLIGELYETGKRSDNTPDKIEWGNAAELLNWISSRCTAERSLLL